jgi:thiol-disulfide isomerase/thioredoxin
VNATTAPPLAALSWRVLLVAVLVARLFPVWQYRSAYVASPLDMLDWRDGAWDAQAGIIAAWAYALLRLRSWPALRKPLLATLAVATLLWVALSIAWAWLNAGQARLSAAALPAFGGGSSALADFKGRPTVVNLWATWCPPCRREMPLLQRAQTAYPQAHFVFVNQGESAARVQGFLSARGLVLPHVLLDAKGQAMREFNAAGLPTTLFFDAGGHLVASHLGELSSAALAQALLRLGVAPALPPSPADATAGAKPHV